MIQFFSFHPRSRRPLSVRKPPNRYDERILNSSRHKLLFTGDIGPLKDDGGQAKNGQEHIKKVKPKLLKKQEHCGRLCGSLILCHENNNQPLFSGSNTNMNRTRLPRPRCCICDSVTFNSTWIFNINPSFTYRTPIFGNDILILFIYTVSASVISRMVRGGGGGEGGVEGFKF